MDCPACRRSKGPEVGNRVAGILFRSWRNYLPRRLSQDLAATNVNETIRHAPGLRRRPQPALGLDEADDALEAFALLQVGHDERPFAAHAPCVGIHLLQGRADM